MTAAPVTQASPSYDKPQAAQPSQPLRFSRSGGALSGSAGITTGIGAQVKSCA